MRVMRRDWATNMRNNVTQEENAEGLGDEYEGKRYL